MKRVLLIAMFLPGFVTAQPIIEAPLEKRLENTIRQYNKEKLPGYFIPVFGIFVRPQNTLLFKPAATISMVDIIFEMKFFRYQPEFGYWRLSLGVPSLPGGGQNLFTGNPANLKYRDLSLRVGTSLGGGYHLLDTRSDKSGQGHALSIMAGLSWEFFGFETFDNSFYNSLGVETEVRYQYNINAFAAFVMGFHLGYKGIFYSLNRGANIIHTGQGLTYGVSLGFSF